MERLSIEQVRELLEEAVPGPWKVLEDGVCVWAYRDGYIYSNISTDVDANCASLVAAAPTLARMVLDMAEELARYKKRSIEQQLQEQRDRGPKWYE